MVNSIETMVEPVKEDRGFQKLLAHLKSGKRAFILTDDHIVVIRPDQPDSIKNWTQLHVSQAGGKDDKGHVNNFSDKTVNYSWRINDKKGPGNNRTNDLKFFLCDQ